MALNSFGSDFRAVVFGASGGIGAALAVALREQTNLGQVETVSRGGDTDHHCDYHNEADLKATAAAIGARGPVHLVIVATGILHGEGIAPEKTWKAIDADVMAEVFAINTIVPTMIAKHMLPVLAKDRRAVFAALSARVGSISDNRLGGWLSYRSSKAALNMALKTLSIELARVNKNAMILGLHPGTVETGLSQPFRGNVPDGKLFAPIHAAQQLLGTIDQAPPDSSGTVLAYDGTRILP